MSYTVERVNWKEHGDEVSTVLAHCFPDVPVARYAWLHERNPAGAGAVWLARAAGGRPVGTAAVHARNVAVDGRVYLAGLATNFAVEPEARAFGPAVALQRAVVAASETGEFEFIYGFPNRAAKSVFERLGYSPGPTRRLARLLRSRPYLERAGRVAAVLARPLDVAMRLAARESWSRRGAHLESIDGFGDDYDRFWSRVRARHPVVAERDAEFMNWRYVDCPSRRYDLAVLRRGREIAATVVSYVIGDVVYIAELFALDRLALDATLAPLLRARRRTGASAVSIILLGDVPWAGRLGTYGFRLRDCERSLMIHVPSGSPLRSLVPRVDRWTLFEGDIL